MKTAFRRAAATLLGVAWVGAGGYYVLLSGKPAWLFDPLLRGVAKAQQPFTGLHVSWDAVEGRLTEGKLHFTKLAAVWQDAGLLGLGKGRKFDCHIAIDDLDIDMGHDVAIMVLRDGKALAKRMDSPDAADELVVPSVRVAGVTGFWSMRVRNPDTPLPNVVINDLRVADCNVTLSDKWRREKPLVFPAIVVADLHMHPYRLRKPVHAALLHANGSGTVGGKAFAIKERSSLVAQVPVEWISSFFRPPLSQIKSGVAQLAVKLQPKGGSLWDTSLELYIGGDKQVSATRTDDLATQAVVAYLDTNAVSLHVRTEINAEAEKEDQFINELALQVSLTLLAKAAQAGAARAFSGWFAGDETSKPKSAQ